MLPITTILIWCLALLLLTIGWARLLGFNKYRKTFIGYAIFQSLLSLALLAIELTYSHHFHDAQVGDSKSKSS